MAKREDPSKKLRDEAKAYVDALPDETAKGRMVTDSGEAADESQWNAQESRQQKLIGMSRRDKKGNQAR